MISFNPALRSVRVFGAGLPQIFIRSSNLVREMGLRSFILLDSDYTKMDPNTYFFIHEETLICAFDGQALLRSDLIMNRVWCIGGVGHLFSNF